MERKITTRAEFARKCGVTAAAITKACDSMLQPACVGRKINENHPAALAYYENRKLAGEHKPKKKRSQSTHVRGHAAKNEKSKADSLRKVAERLAEDGNEDEDERDNSRVSLEPPADIREFLDMTLRELIDRFGTDVAFADWLKATKSIEDINEKRLKNAVTQGELVSRELVRVGVIEPIDSAHRKLLTDGAKTISRRVMAMVGAGEDLEAIEAFVVDQVASFIRPVKAQVARSMKNG